MVKPRHGTTAEWTAADAAGRILALAELGWDSDTGELKIGDGVSDFADLTAIATVDLIPEARGGLIEDDGNIDVAAVNVQEFPTAGSFSGGWAKPANLVASSIVRVFLQSGGGGGGSGCKGAEGTDRGGGWGGSSGPVKEFEVLASTLGATEDVVVGAGGTGGAAVSANTTLGNTGGNGGVSTFAGVSSHLGPAGGGGVASSVLSTNFDFYGQQNNVQSSRPYASGGQGASNSGLFSFGGGHGQSGAGGGGSFRTAANADPVGGSGPGGTGLGGGGGAFVAAGVVGTAGTTSTNGLLGGGGGAGGGRAAAGGAGGWPGGGGGGGGVGINSASNSGAGGVGGHGYVRIVTIR